jgi:LAO/AO transport system kinase
MTPDGLGVSVAPGGEPSPHPPAATPRRAPTLSIDEYAAGVFRANRAILGRAISLIESTSPRDRSPAEQLIARILPRAGNSIRVGITGVPGAGKSTFIERLGCMLTARGRRVAVLAVDPSSGVTGGSILGDKTRMSGLAADDRAFIRPSPSAGALGGVARKTRQAMLLCEAAGFDVVLVETVGVGQSETTVADMTDFFLAVLIAGAGDELQGIKRGLLELVDLIAVNKADGESQRRATAAAREYASALRMVARRDPGWDPPVLTCSALTGDGIDDIWQRVDSRIAALRASGALAANRREQELRWFHALLHEQLEERLAASPAAAAARQTAEQALREARTTPSQAATSVIDAFVHELNANPRSSGASA